MSTPSEDLLMKLTKASEPIARWMRGIFSADTDTRGPTSDEMERFLEVFGEAERYTWEVDRFIERDFNRRQRG